ncbi:OsmC family protein [Aureibacter tunicatorum]|uniref:Redox protein n=1 Tax=Aureibacter tunicatorum TaxID=866807 RepID=A0AAE3XLJ4_9BACT|nr:OsmC family protein [Aureibacter tunicatorum]MDR6239117.1 putative redox protein [Aureibacter tunicatorum]BDD04957.1 hypothetical protein AUTU_24400 [Aureibacter tunicatorum]
MKVELTTDGFSSTMKAVNEKGAQISLGASADAENALISPMELVLAGAGGCSTIDIVSILKKQKQEVRDIKVDIEGDRVEDIPRVFRKINMHYKVYGDVDASKVERAIALSVEKYCSVSKMLESSVEITTSFEVIS